MNLNGSKIDPTRNIVIRDSAVKIVKKRRRENAVSGSSGKDGVSSNDCWNLEEAEAEKRDPEKDLVMFKQACDEIRRVMKDILEIKKGRNVDNDILEKRIQACMMFVALKKLNRLEKIRNKKARDATNDMKQKVDSYHLQLQNLLYEVTHLQKEVNKCLEFKSKDEDIELVPVNEFYKMAPAEISKPEITKNDNHKQTLARLDWELEQRKRLAEKCTVAESTKDVISQEIKTKQEYLDNLSPRLNTILQATIPVQNYLGMPIDTLRTQHKLARFLPSPLFIFFIQASAYAEGCDKRLTLVVEGDVDEAKALKDSTEDGDIDSDSDQEEFGGEKRHHRKSTSDRMAETRKKTLEKHPLSVVMTITCKDGSSLKMNFAYLLVLHVVTVKAKFTPSSNQGSSVSSRDLLTPDLLLSCLYPGDDGRDTPNPANDHQLRRIGLAEFRDYIAELGYPYLWAQRLSGLDFLQRSTAECDSAAVVDGDNVTKPSGSVIIIDIKPSASVSATHMEKTIRAIRVRLSSRIALQRHLHALEQGNVPLTSESLELFPAKMSRLVSWQSIPWEDFKIQSYARQFIDENIVDETDFIFEAIVERGSAKLKANVAVSANYPNYPPVFMLRLDWKSSKSVTTGDSIREMEREINVHWMELVPKGQTWNNILVNQVQRLLMCFDVYLESETIDAAVEGPAEFSKEKVFFRQSRGRNRSKPYHFLPKLGLFVQR